MGIVFAPEQVFDDVVARFGAEGTVVTNAFGWRKRAKHKVGESRIVWVPGDNDNAGAVLPPAINHDARQLGKFEELLTVYVAGYDADNPTDERAQYNATRALFDAWYRAVYLDHHGAFRILGLRWMVPRTELPHGVELACVVAFKSPIPDTPYTFAPADTTADIATSLEDVTEQTVASPFP